MGSSPLHPEQRGIKVNDPHSSARIYVYVPSPHSLPLMLAARSGNVDTRLWERSPRNPTILGEGAKEGG